jgi:hypothetical protein
VASAYAVILSSKAAAISSRLGEHLTSGGDDALPVAFGGSVPQQDVTGRSSTAVMT